MAPPKIGMEWIKKWVPRLGGFFVGLGAPSMFDLAGVIEGLTGGRFNQFGGGRVNPNHALAAGIYLSVGYYGIHSGSVLVAAVGGFGFGGALAHGLLAIGKNEILGFQVA